MSTVTQKRDLSHPLFSPTPDGLAADGWPVASAEAPEKANSPREAPESVLDRAAEAPDAGVGRAHYLEHEFTHGRSQS